MTEPQCTHLTREKTRVLLLSPSFPPARGGIERTAGGLAGHLPSSDLTIVAGHPPDISTADRTALASAPVHWVNNDPAGGRRATLGINVRAVSLGLRVRPAVVLATHIRMMPAARALALTLHSRSVVVVHAKEMREQPGLARAAVAWADSVVAASSFSKALAIEAGASIGKIRVINPGVSIPRISPPPVTQRPGPPTVLTIARIDDPHKGHAQALDVMGMLRARVPGVRWIVIGEGRLREELIGRTAEMGLDGCLQFVGALSDDELTRHLSTAHVFCLPSQMPKPGAAGEGFGMVLVEAAAWGLPVVAGRVPGVTDAVLDGTNGLLADPGDTAAIAAAIETLLTDDTLRAKFGRAGRDRAAELDWPRVGERYQTLMDQLVRQPLAGNGSPTWSWLSDFARGPHTS